MQTLYCLGALAGAAYFACARRRFDLLALGYLSALVYFLPALFGYVLPPETVQGFRDPVPITAPVYLVYLLVLCGLVAGAAVLDLAAPAPPRLPALPRPEVAERAFLAAALVGFAATVWTSGGALFAADKSLVLDAVGRWRLLWVNAAVLGMVFTFLRRRWAFFAAFGCLLSIDLYVGFRNNLALAVLALATAWLAARGQRRLVVHGWRLGIVSLVVALAFFAYKQLYNPIKRGDWEEVEIRVSDPAFLADSLVYSEPFVTQAILNEVMLRDFHVPASGLAEVFYNFGFFAPSFGVEASSIGTVFKDVLFPGTPAGIGSNPWAEMWSRGGWPLLIGFVCGFVVVLGFASWLLAARDPAWLSLVAVNGAYWAFYLHRNTLTYQVNLHKRLVLLWLLAVGLALVAGAFARFAGASGRPRMVSP